MISTLITTLKWGFIAGFAYQVFQEALEVHSQKPATRQAA